MNKLFLYGLAGVLALGALIGILMLTGAPDEVAETKPEPAAVEEPQGPAPEPAAEQEPVKLTPPSFDVVRVNPRGDAVIAGRAHPGALVIIMDGDQALGEVTADDRGEWVFLPDEPLKPGTRQLSLDMRVPGHDPVLSETVVVLSVPEPGKTLAGEPAGEGDGALAVEMRRDGTGGTRVLQKPTAPPKELAIAIDSVDYNDQGGLIIAGQTDIQGLVQVYLGETFLGRATANDQGLWRVEANQEIKPGVYELRADRVDEEARVLARASTPFRKDETVPNLDAGTFVIVQPGSSLWRIARRSYGSGFAYTVIFEANQGQIKDPDLIYPGQVFNLPGK